MTIMEASKLRANSLRIANDLGYVSNEHLPLLDYQKVVRSVDETVDRLLGMYCVAAVAYGFDRQRATDWLCSNVRNESLTSGERKFLETGNGALQDYKFQIEGIWTLYWTCGLAGREFSFGTQCPQDFVTRLPDLKENENAQQFRSRAALRDVVDIVQMADTAYCIHWAIRHASLSGRTNANPVPEYVIRERRHALDWLVENEDWENVSLDT